MRSAVTSELHGVNDKNVEQRLNHYRKFLYEKGGTDGGQRPEVGDRKSDQGRDSCAQCPRFSAGSSDQSGIAGDSHLDRAQSSAKAEPQGAVAPSQSPIFIKWPVTSSCLRLRRSTLTPPPGFLLRFNPDTERGGSGTNTHPHHRYPLVGSPSVSQEARIRADGCLKSPPHPQQPPFS